MAFHSATIENDFLNEHLTPMSNILHLFWHPEPKQNFLQMGGFRLWIETVDSAKTKKQNLHPRHFNRESLSQWLKDCTGLNVIAPSQFDQRTLMLPTAQGQPLPCPELMIDMADDLLDQVEWADWTVDCYRLADNV